MRTRFLAHWRLKLLLTVALNAFFWTLYSFLGRHSFFPLRNPPLTWLDHAIPFQPEPWVWIYLSQFLFTGTLPWFLATKHAVTRYAIGFVAMCSVSFAIFLISPVASPRPENIAPGSAMNWVLHYDATLNAFPSLHAAFLVYMAMLTKRMFGNALSASIVVGGAIWGTLILYATIATRQHYVVDLLAGAVIGAAADWVAWRGRYSDTSEVTVIARKSGVTSHDGCR